ncbi:MAG: acetolactate synthase small subunit [Chloroflexaceae bacterium]|nr:acetolactate synthase small subunit [Chloroflexaceae bacterium]
MKRHTIIALMQDQPGVLNRAVSLFRRRGYNIASLAVGHTEIPNISRMTVVVESDEVEQVVKQLDRLIEVVNVTDVTYESTVDREMTLLKVGALNGNRAEIVALCEVFNAKVVDVSQESMIIEMTGSPAKVENFIEVMEPFGINEMMRTGIIAMVRGAKTSHTHKTYSVEGNGRVSTEALK